MAAERDPQIKAILETLEYDVDTAKKLAEDLVKGGDRKLAPDAKSALTTIYLLKGMPDKAKEAAEEAVAMSKGSGSKACEATALNALAAVLVSMGSPEDLGKAFETSNEALSILKGLGDSAAQTEVYRTLMSAKLVDKKNPEARQVVEDAVAAFKAAGDTTGQAAAQVLLSEACLATGKNADAVKAAKAAVALYEKTGDKPGQAAALAAVVAADLTNEQGEAVWAAGERVNLFKELGDQWQEAGALNLLAQAHVTRLGLRLATCSIASAEDTMAALKTAKDAHALYEGLGDRTGMDSAMGFVSRVMMFNGVPGHIIESLLDPDEVLQDVMSGKYSSQTNSFPPKPQPKQLKVEELIPSSKQLDRGKFSWNKPTEGFCYTLIWQATKDRNIQNKKPRGSYDIMTLNTGAKTMSVSNAFTALSNDAAERNASLVIYMTSHDSSQTYASNIMSQQSTLASMITARLSKVTFMQFNEAHFNWTDTRCRMVQMYPVTLALMRSCRIEAPTVNIGYVAGDAHSWIADPAPLIENLFDTLESDECELMYTRNESFAPLIIHRPMDDGIQFVKPKKPNSFSK